MNKTQKNFKKQMQDIEKKQQKAARKNEGIFSNRLFELRFYGYNGGYKKPQNILILFIKKIINLIFFTIKWIIIAMGIFVLFFIITAVIIKSW